MKLIKVLLIFFTISSFSTYAHSLSGLGPVKFSSAVFDYFLEYMRGDGNSKGEVG